MTTYSYDISPVSASTITTQMNDLTVRINLDPYLSPNLLTSVTYSGNNLFVNFTNALTEKLQFDILFCMVNSIFKNLYAGLDYDFNNQMGKTRNVYNQNHIPGYNDDLYCGYNTGSIIFNSSNKKCYICVDPSVGNAIWNVLGTDFNNNFIILTRNSNYVTNYSTATNFDLNWDNNLDTDTSFFTFSSTGVTINKSGIYLITAVSPFTNTSSTNNVTMKIGGVNGPSDIIRSVTFEDLFLCYPISIIAGTFITLNYNVSTPISSSVLTINSNVNMSIMYLSSIETNLEYKKIYCNFIKNNNTVVNITTALTDILFTNIYTSSPDYFNLNPSYYINISPGNYKITYSVLCDFYLTTNLTTICNFIMILVGTNSGSSYIPNSYICARSQYLDTRIDTCEFELTIPSNDTYSIHIGVFSSSNSSVRLPSPSEIPNSFLSYPPNQIWGFIEYLP